LISNIHAQGVSLEAASTRIVELAAQMIASGSSGVALKEQTQSSLPPVSR
jgi:ethanolamine ammonia-lyase small subunit